MYRVWLCYPYDEEDEPVILLHQPSRYAYARVVEGVFTTLQDFKHETL